LLYKAIMRSLVDLKEFSLKTNDKMYNFFTKRLMRPSGCVSKILLIMRLTTLLLITAILQVSAGSYAQRITLSEKNAPIKVVLDKIRIQSGFDFLFTTTNLRNAKPVNINVKDADLKTVLKEVFEGQPFDYSVERKSVVVSKKEPSFLDKLSSVFSAVDVRGRVVDENGKPMTGVSIGLKGTSTKSTVSNEQGFFSISVSENAVLVFSYVGYATREMTARQTMVVVMQLSQNKLDETVVVGYGSVKRKDLTGSVSSVDLGEVKNVPYMSFDNALVGKAAGVQVIKADGAPGGAVRIRIRGGTSLIGSNDPLYIIDGIPVTVENKYIGVTDMTNPVENYGGENARNSSISGSFARGLNNLSGLNIDDIESIDILKDASATAIYGSKAANGVVIITTKKGKLNEKPVLEMNYYGGYSQARSEKVLNRDQYLAVLKEAAQNRVTEDQRLARTPDPAALSVVNGTANLGTGNTDWLDQVLRNGITQNANVSVRGGGTGSRYYTSLAYTQQKGVLIGTDFNRISGKVSLDNEITSKLRVITNLDYGFTKNNVTNGLYGNTLLAPPTISPYNADGSYTVFDNFVVGSDFGVQNPLALATATNQGKTNMLLGSLSGEYDIIKDLKFKSVISVNYSSYNQRNYIPSYLEIANPNSQGGVTSGGGVGSQSANESVNTFIENTLTWNKEFNASHRLNLLGGTSFEKYRAEFFSAEGRTFPDDTYLNNLSSAATATQVRGSNPSGTNALLSFYLRANYAFKERYLLTFTGRADISSKFAQGHQTGYFPSGAIAWKVNEESFLKDVKWINELKIRVSAGTTGTNSIADNMFRTLYTPTSYAGASALVPTQLGNDQIKWESTFQRDLGLDYSFFNNRLRGTIGYYEKTTDGVLLNITTAPSYAFGTVVLNVAEIRNRGLEFDVRGDIIRAKNFNWNSALNIARNRSKVLKINGGPFSDPNNRNSINLGTSIVKEGEPLGLLYGRVATGVIKTQKEVDDQKAAYPNYTSFNRWLNIGDLAYEIVNNNMKQDIIGNSTPDFFGGFTNTFSYKNLSLITLMTFSYGNDILYQADVSNRQVINNVNKGTAILDHYSASNPNSNRQRLLWGGTAFNTKQNVYDGSYLKMKSVTLSYDMPRKIADKLKMRMASVYFTATNLFTITNYPGLDPEISDAPGSIVGGGRDLSTYPTTRELTVGLRFGL
jgi:TonB-linked SusC/RagA family outer membrane protein